MWSFILLLGVCSPHWTTGEVIVRNTLNIHIIEKNGNEKSLVSVNSPHNPDYGKAINISALELDTIEDGAFSELNGAESLNLEHNRLRELNLSSFSNLPNLTTISVGHNYITKFYGSLVGSPNLKYLNLSDNNITDLKESNLEALPEFVEIIMGKARLQQDQSYLYGEQLQIHPWYQYLILDTMYWRVTESKRPNSPVRGKEPISLKLCRTDDGTVESVKVMAQEESHTNCLSIDTSRNTSMVRLNNYGLEKFQRGWFQAPDIFKEIDLSINNISKITPELLNDLPPFIEAVLFQSTNTKTIEKNIIDNKFLKKIELIWNPLVTVEAGAFEKTKLHSIRFFGCSLSSIEFVRTLPTTLKDLDLNFNQISELPENCLANLKRLEALDLEKNQLTHLPLNIFRGLKELRLLNIGSNRLQKIEAGIFDDNEKLEIFAAHGNSIVELEDGVFKNTKGLKLIRLDRNKIKKISSKTFLGLKNGYLHWINLSSNQIDTIEEGSFANMSIDNFNLFNNQLTEKSVAKGAFESCKLGAIGAHLYTIAVECTIIPQHNYFYGLKLRYETKGIYTVSRNLHLFVISIPD